MDEQNIDDIISMLDAKTTSGVSRIKIQVNENQDEEVSETKQFGRCDINSQECN